MDLEQEDNEVRRVLVCPLNWGLGHAARVVPIIYKLLEQKFTVIVAASGYPMSFLKEEFPGLEYIYFPNYTIRYSSRNSQVLKLALKLPEIIYFSIKEHYTLKKIIARYKVDIVISDNRFGLWDRNVYSIFISHQLSIRFPGALKIFGAVYKAFIKRLIKKYNECWVPDVEGEKNLAGVLSHGLKTDNVYFVGILSRFAAYKTQKPTIKKHDILFLLSGPENQRTVLEGIFIVGAGKTGGLNYAMVRGTDKKMHSVCPFPVFNFLNTKELYEIICSSDTVVCRAGYSTVMDMVALGKRAVLVPTPGQTEQEYLAKYLNQNPNFCSIKQTDFTVQGAIQKAKTLVLGDFEKGYGLLDERIKGLNEI